ncbi:MAG: T9SS type A sorting domain-containing protein [Bacteroidales bacterium]|nr:T9SS type A sorting domain-containing protein [Bacteroidales bacterium]
MNFRVFFRTGTALLFLLLLNNIVPAQENIALKADDILTSHVSSWEDLYAINNGIDPVNSGDKTGGAYGNWTGTDNLWNWVEYDWDSLYIISRSDIYWWADGQGIVIPYETYQEYWDFLNNKWMLLPDAKGNGIERDQYNITTFTPVLTNKIRVHMISTIATGILEWKVWGEQGEQVPMGTSTDIDQPLAKNSVTNVIVTAKDHAGIPVEGYVFKLDIEIKDALSATAEVYTIDGIAYTAGVSGFELAPTSASGEVQFSITLPAGIDHRDGITVRILFNNGITGAGDPLSYYEPGLVPPVLTPDQSDNTVDQEIVITFPDDPDWRASVSALYAGGNLLTPDTDYEITTGAIHLKPSGGNPALTVSGIKDIRIEATGYEDNHIGQEILPGAVDPETTSVRTLAGLYQPTRTHIEIRAMDRFFNPVQGYQFQYDITVINNNALTAEVYEVNNVDITESLENQSTLITGLEGTTRIPVYIPRPVDRDDGIEITLKLEDGTPVEPSIAYINDGTDKEIVLQNAVRTNAGFSWDRTAQSDDFIVYWGEKITGEPTDAVNGDLAFDPQNILGILEDLLVYFVDTIHFITNPDTLNMGRYKHEVVMNETWNSGFTGWAFGGWADEKIGGMWIHPRATNGPATLAHEFTHMNQCMVFLQYPGYGLNMPYAGFFWESHANFMMKNYTDTYTGVQPERYIFTSMMQYSTTRRHYQNLYFLDYLVDKYGMETVNDIWRKGDPESSHPLTSLRDSVLRYTQDDLNDEFGYHAMKNVTWDYSGGEKIRAAIRSVDPIYVQRMYTVPDSVFDEPGTFVVPEYLAPGDYGYNIIPLYPDAGSSEVTIHFTGLENQPAGGAGWRYGFVGVDHSGTPRYSTLFSDSEGTATFTLSPSDSTIYFVVTGAPQRHHNYPWEPGYPKVYRYPYLFQIEGALPEGHKPGYNSLKETHPGAPHPNGGGWVASTAGVAPTAYVGPNAQVLGTARVLHNARIEDYAIVKDNSVVSENAIVRDHAIVGGGSIVSHDAIVEKSARVFSDSRIRDKAVVTGSALLYGTTLTGSAVAKDLARLYYVSHSGTTIIGGDAEEHDGYSAGTHLQMSRSSGNDGLINHPANLDVNPAWEVYIYPKGEKPAPPANLAPVETTDHSVTLSWDQAPDYREVESYYLFREGELLEIISGTAATVSNLSPQTTYSFAVKAVDRSGNVSAYSEIIDVTTLVSGVDLPEDPLFKVYPNPVNRYLYLESSLEEETRYVITDLPGRVVLSGRFTRRMEIRKEDIGEPGIYFVTLEGYGGKSTIRIALSD